MRIFKIYSFLIFLITASLSAQEFKNYKTQKGETLKAIADKFEVNYRTLLSLNPGISRRPQENTEIKIPADRFVRVNHPIDFRPDNKEDLTTVAKDSVKIHVVQPKETLYSLSKSYDVSMATLIKYNSVLSQEGLKIGQELRVPIKKITPVKETVISLKKHKVVAQETLYGLSKMYGVGIEELKKANPQIEKEGLKLGAVIEIPSTGVESVLQKDTLNKSTYIISEGETLYSIAQKHGVSITELLNANQSVVIDSLKVGSLLRLPLSNDEVTIKGSSIHPIYKNEPIKYTYRPYTDTLSSILGTYEISEDSLRSINPSIDSILNYGGDLLLGFKKIPFLFYDYQKFEDSIVTDRLLSVVLMLPFEFTKNDTLSEKVLFSRENGLPNIVSDFYLGAEMAIDSLKKQGVKINLEVVDTENSVDVIDSHLEKIKKLEPNLIIGPLYSGNAMYVATHFPKTPVYYPVYSSKQSKFLNSNLMKTSTDKDVFEREITKYIQENRKEEHLVIVGKQENISKLNALKAKFSRRDSLGVLIEDDVSVVTLSRGYFTKQDFEPKIKANKSNWVLIAENNNVITNDVFSIVRGISRKKDLNAAFRVLSFEKLDFVQNLSYDKLATYKYTYATDEVEYDEFLGNAFNDAYFKKNNVYPGNYAIRGFGVTYDAILRALGEGVKKYGATQRGKQAFYYKKNDFPINGNQAVFVNYIENTEEEGLKIVRLR